MEAQFETEQYLPLTPLSLAVLLALGDQDRHGYAIIQEVVRQTGGALRPGTGTLYAALQRMLEDGSIGPSRNLPQPDEDQRRRYYGITELGRAVARAEVARMRRAIEIADEKDLMPKPATESGS